MTIDARLIIVTTTIALLGGCVLPPQQPVQVSTQPTQPTQPVQTVQSSDPLNQEALKVLLDLAGIREEIKRLRNSIEEVQFETENTKRRQQDLFQKLEQRMVSIERNQQVLNPQPEGVFSQGDVDDPQGGDGRASQVVVGDSNAISNDQANEGNDQNNNQSNPENTSVNQITTASENASTANNTSTPVSASPTTAQEQQAYDQAFKLLTQSRYQDAIAQFQQLVDTWSHSQLADDAYYWMSEARYVNREFEHALSGFKALVSKYPDSQRVPEALLKIGYIQHDIGDYEKAANTFRDILARFPGHQVTVSAQTRLRRIEQTIQ